MKLPRVRFTVRRLVVAVAIVAAGLGAIEAYERWTALEADYWTKARLLRVRAHMEETSAFLADESLHAEASPSGRLEDAARMARRRAEYYRRLGKKYERAAYRPWWPVEVDPPEPE